MADFLVRPRHTIEIATFNGPPIIIDFESRDIGATQGTTLRLGGEIIAQYKPGTRHWDSALESAVELVNAGVAQAMAADLPLIAAGFRQYLAAVMAERGEQPWDGRDPEPW